MKWEGKVAVCMLLEAGKVKPEDIGIKGEGCALKHIPDVYQYYMEIYGAYLGSP